MSEQLDRKAQSIAKFIVKKGKTTYAEIAEVCQISSKTIAKYLNEIERIVNTEQITLIRKTNDGIYFEGDQEAITKRIDALSSVLPSTREDRADYLLRRLITAMNPVTIQTFSDELFVSRKSIESALKLVKDRIEREGIKLESGRQGLWIPLDEEMRRRMISQALHYYWGGEASDYFLARQKEGAIIRSYSDVDDFFDHKILKRVQSLIDDFVLRKGYSMTDYEYQTLTLHLAIAIERIQKQQYLHSSLYSYDVSDTTWELIREVETQFEIEMPVFEREYLNLHVLALQSQTSTTPEMKQFETDEHQVLKVLIATTLAHLSYDSELLQGLTLHLASTIHRLKFGLHLQNPFTTEIKVSFPQAFEDALLIKQAVETQYHIGLDDDEVAFIALHIAAFYERTNTISKKIRTILVCSSGLGTSQLLFQRISNLFPNEISVTRIASLTEIKIHPIQEQLIITTVPISDVNLPLIQVSPFLYEHDIEKIRNVLHDFQSSQENLQAFIELMEDRLIIFSSTHQLSREQAIAHIGDALIQNDYAGEGIIESALERDTLSTTAYNIIAMPHGNPEFVKTSKIALLINKEGIIWGDKTVHIVFFFALNQSVKKEVKNIFACFYELVYDDVVLKQMVQSTSASEVKAVLNRAFRKYEGSMMK